MREALRKEILDMIMVKEISYDMIRYDSRREYFSYVHKKEIVFSYVRTSYIIYRDKETFLIFVLTI